MRGANQERNARIVDLARAGYSAKTAAVKSGLSVSRVEQIAREAGVPFCSSRFWSDEEIARLRRLLRTHTIKQAASALGRSYGQVLGQANYRRIPFKREARAA